MKKIHFEKLYKHIKKYIKANPYIWRWVGMVLVIVGLGIIIYSQGWFKRNDFFNEQYVQLPSGEENISSSTDIYTIPADKEGNWIVIPKMGVDAAIYEGSESVLNKGVWHLPRTSTPDKGSNTVISAHRWLYKPPDPRTFFNIDKIAVGDAIYLRWDNVDYNYKVVSTEIITPDRVDILKPTDKPLLTLFSCTPLYSTSHRLVVKAELVD